MHKNREPVATYKVDRERGTTSGVCAQRCVCIQVHLRKLGDERVEQTLSQDGLIIGIQAEKVFGGQHEWVNPQRG